MNEQRNNGRGIFYGVIGVATLVVAIIGATFAYFTATASNNIITGNMATVSLGLSVTKVTDADVTQGGMIPMSNGMVQAAVNKGYSEVDDNGTTEDASDDVTTVRPCIDDNGNAVCQVYKITLTNSSSAGQFVDGYVALRGGSGAAPTDLMLTEPNLTNDTNGNGVCDDDETTCTGTAATFYSYDAGAKFTVDNGTATSGGNGTTMRWAQVFLDTTNNSDTATLKKTVYTTAGTQSLGGASVTYSAIGNTGTGDVNAHNIANIRTQKAYMLPAATGDTNDNGICDDGDTNCTSGTANGEGTLTSVQIAGNYYDAIGTNYIRLSNHEWAADGGRESYDREDDITSALVFNHSIPANGTADYYVVVWLSETGTNQTAGATVGDGTNPVAAKFFLGNVTFVSAQGSEVSATFSGYTRVESDQV